MRCVRSFQISTATLTIRPHRYVAPLGLSAPFADARAAPKRCTSLASPASVLKSSTGANILMARSPRMRWASPTSTSIPRGRRARAGRTDPCGGRRRTATGAAFARCAGAVCAGGRSWPPPRAAGASGGAAILLDGRTGETIALASWPAFNPNTAGEAVANARRDRVAGDVHELGSTIKPFTVAMALQEELTTNAERFDLADAARRRRRHHPGP